MVVTVCLLSKLTVFNLLILLIIYGGGGGNRTGVSLHNYLMILNFILTDCILTRSTIHQWTFNSLVRFSCSKLLNTYSIFLWSSLHGFTIFYLKMVGPQPPTQPFKNSKRVAFEPPFKLISLVYDLLA